MRTLISCLILLGLASGLSGQKNRPMSPLVAMVKTEQAFAKASEERGTRESFLQFIADDGILFRPKAVLGKQWMIDNPQPPSEKRPLLAWQPIFADISAYGDMGYTTGPWEFKSDINDPKPAAYGQFITVWKKQSNGEWKFAIDLGISHPTSAGPLKIWEISDGKRSTGSALSDLDVAKKSLLDRETQFTALAQSQTPALAFSRFADNNIRLFREGDFPFVGKRATLRTLSGMKDRTTWTRAGQDISQSGDLAYLYGTYETRTNDSNAKTTGEGNFLRIWQKVRGQWLIVLDVATPIQQ